MQNYVFDFVPVDGQGQVPSRNLLAGNVCFLFFMSPENEPVDMASYRAQTRQLLSTYLTPLLSCKANAF